MQNPRMPSHGRFLRFPAPVRRSYHRPPGSTNPSACPAMICPILPQPSSPILIMVNSLWVSLVNGCRSRKRHKEKGAPSSGKTTFNCSGSKRYGERHGRKIRGCPALIRRRVCRACGKTGLYRDLRVPLQLRGYGKPRGGAKTRRGARLLPLADEADAVIINTCTVVGPTERRMLRRLAALREKPLCHRLHAACPAGGDLCGLFTGDHISRTRSARPTVLCRPLPRNMWASSRSHRAASGDARTASRARRGGSL